MTQDRFNTFKTLIRGAKAITIALEPSCVMDCCGGEVTCEEVENWLVALIKECVDADIKHESDSRWMSLPSKCSSLPINRERMESCEKAEYRCWRG